MEKIIYIFGLFLKFLLAIPFFCIAVLPLGIGLEVLGDVPEHQLKLAVLLGLGVALAFWLWSVCEKRFFHLIFAPLDALIDKYRTPPTE